ncbi:hypothetical protein WMY93_015409 [Mugilogobius chulae]|uniref:Uncharacterized protein n=1 Tax=Mugilogobius chulae TaxID=88201 RepID=A0AAW0NR63_9GOBI
MLLSTRGVGDAHRHCSWTSGTRPSPPKNPTVTIRGVSSTALTRDQLAPPFLKSICDAYGSCQSLVVHANSEQFSMTPGGYKSASFLPENPKTRGKGS